MTITVDFYILQATEQQSLFFACQLLEKSYQCKERAYVHVDSHEEANRFDDLLWIYRDDSFLPHERYRAHKDLAPIQIGFETVLNNDHTYHVLVNLSAEIPAFYHLFNHVIEIVSADPNRQHLARKRYIHYRDHGHKINTHKE